MNPRPSRILLAVLAVGLFVLTLAFAQPLAASNAPVAPAAVAASNWGGCTYWVRPGDTLYGIAARYGVSWWYLAQLNGIYNPHFIYAGTMLNVPCGGGYPPQYPPKYPPKQCDPALKYLVKPGDNLFRIALNYGTTVNALRDANNLWGRVLRAGMTLIIACPAPDMLPEKTALPPKDTVPQFAPTESAPNGQAPVLPTGKATGEPGGKPTAVPPPLIVTAEATGAPQGTPAAQGTPLPTMATNALPPEPSATVNLQNGALDPTAVTVKAGQAVLWINSENAPVTLVSGTNGQSNNLFSSPELPPGGTFIFTFTTAGNYPYFVQGKPNIQGQINVTP